MNERLPQVTQHDARHLLSLGMELGEGPIWIGDRLWFVDIKGRVIFRFDPTGETLDRWPTPEVAGWILPGAADTLIVGLRTGPARFSPKTGAFAPLAAVDADRPANRLNDAAVHPSGRVYFGSMDDDEATASGRVFVLDAGRVTPTAIPPAVVTNGPAIAPAGDRLFHVDTLARHVTVHAIDDDGVVGVGETFLRFSGNEGHPDGATCDREGGVWIGFFGGWAARRYDAAGRLTDEVRFPVANVTKVALGGLDGRTAFATTARQGLSTDELARQPLAGDVFTFPVAIAAAAACTANT